MDNKEKLEYIVRAIECPDWDLIKIRQYKCEIEENLDILAMLRNALLDNADIRERIFHHYKDGYKVQEWLENEQ